MCFVCVQEGRAYQQKGPNHIEAAGETTSSSGAGSFNIGVNYVDSLTDDLSWSGTVNQSVSVEYTFANSSRGTLFSAADQALALQAMQEFSNVANITFTQGGTDAAMTFARHSYGSSNTTGVSYYRYYDTELTAAETTVRYDLNINLGNSGYGTLLHELGHSVGLKHSGNYDSTGSSVGGPYLPDSEDTERATVMSYNGYYGDTGYTYHAPAGLQIYDIAALQHIYGANTSYNSGDTSYSFDGGSYVSGNGNLFTLWDGAGTDTLTAQSYSGSATLDLREGLAFESTIGMDKILIAYGANIENAYGTIAGDNITGNDLGNQLNGGNGADTLAGGNGNDTLFGGDGVVDTDDSGDQITAGSGNDQVYGNSGNDHLYGNSGSDLIYGGRGNDHVYGNEDNDSVYGGGSEYNPADEADTVYGGAGNDLVLGNGSGDVLYGGTGNDTLLGGQGNDTIDAGDGNDLIRGLLDNDVLTGGNGADTFYFGSGHGSDIITDFVSGTDIIQIASGTAGIVDAAGALAASTGNMIGLGDTLVTVSSVAGFTEADFMIV